MATPQRYPRLLLEIAAVVELVEEAATAWKTASESGAAAASQVAVPALPGCLRGTFVVATASAEASNWPLMTAFLAAVLVACSSDPASSLERSSGFAEATVATGAVSIHQS